MLRKEAPRRVPKIEVSHKVLEIEVSRKVLKMEVSRKVLKKEVSRKVLIMNWSPRFVHCRHLICFLNWELPDNDWKEFGARFYKIQTQNYAWFKISPIGQSEVMHFLPRFHFPHAPPLWVGLAPSTKLKTAYSPPSARNTSRNSDVPLNHQKPVSLA